MIKYLQLPFYFDVQRMQEELLFLDNKTWQPHYQKLHYEGEWSAIPLRSVEGKADNIFKSPIENILYKDTIFLASCPYFEKVLGTFKCPLQTVRLLKLNAGATIREHRDTDLNFENGEIRLHIPVVTNKDVEFYLDKEPIQLKEGECWYLNFNLPHHITNKSSFNRTHLVIDALVNDWLKVLFTSTGIPVKKEIEDTSNYYDANTKRLMILRFREMNTEVSNKMADELEKQLIMMN